jgi:hypothetical protein
MKIGRLYRTGEKMNNWHTEFMAEHHRQEILVEAEQIRMENMVLRVRVYRPRFFARTMYTFANWMISTGKQLRKRYEVPAVNCSKTESFAH